MLLLRQSQTAVDMCQYTMQISNHQCNQQYYYVGLKKISSLLRVVFVLPVIFPKRNHFSNAGAQKTLQKGDMTSLETRCLARFQCAFTACVCIFKKNTLVGSNQRNYFKNTTACIKRTLKMHMATQLKWRISLQSYFEQLLSWAQVFWSKTLNNECKID